MIRSPVSYRRCAQLESRGADSIDSVNSGSFLAAVRTLAVSRGGCLGCLADFRADLLSTQHDAASQHQNWSDRFSRLGLTEVGVIKHSVTSLARTRLLIEHSLTSMSLTPSTPSS